MTGGLVGAAGKESVLGVMGPAPRSYFPMSGPHLGTSRLIWVALCSQFRPHLGVRTGATEGVWGVIL